ncbi:Hypothetical predicted protein [Olea europaea subsp. europaea]|uniref:Uncharacterized protein n=1 Tax=Olea europaea subsp. europaea TaxID=158383 RepID=A0A8S0SZI6_OLEEU|nr:Hypothetical predicted protein [Olea europaea subsp. europaea]
MIVRLKAKDLEKFEKNKSHTHAVARDLPDYVKQKKSSNPSSIGHKEVWAAAHIKKNGEPICKLVEETLEKLKDASPHASNTNIKEDALSKVLGP